jgi:hypothetical protein
MIRFWRPQLHRCHTPAERYLTSGKWFGEPGARLIASLARRYPREVVVALGCVADLTFFAQGEAMDRVLAAVLERSQLSEEFSRSIMIPPRPTDVRKFLRRRTGFAE